MSVIVHPSRLDQPDIDVLDDDLDERTFERALGAVMLAWDIETTGLDWRHHRIGTVQLKADNQVFIVRLNGHRPRRLKSLLEDPSILKVMHHAMFDLRFMAFQWGATPRTTACTKIASKLLAPSAPNEEHSLAALVRRRFGVELDKSQRLTDWNAELSPSQIRYAAGDVRFLQPLYEELTRELRHKSLLRLRDDCYEHLLTRVQLELGGYPDIYDY
jgi:ribonuclease D